MLTLCAFLVAGGSAGAAKEKPGAKKAAPAATVDLVREGTTPFRIEVRSPNAREATFAAGELTRYLAKLSGAALEPADAKTTGPRIVVGMRDDLSPADRALLPPAAKGHDGYAIAVTPGGKGREARIVIGGDAPRGLVYAVYDLLERLGCVFTHPRLDPSDPEIVPSKRDLALPAGRWAVASKLKLRTLAWFEWRKPKRDGLDTTPEELAAQIDWAMKSRYNAFESAALELPPDHPLFRALHAAKERGMMLQAPGHNFGLFLPSDLETFNAHPEWFGLHDGKRLMHNEFGSQFCWTNQEARQVFTDNVLSFVRERPDLDVLELSGLDGGKFLQVCGCDACRKLGTTDSLIDMLNGVVRRLAKERPDLIVETLGGYQYSEEPPRTVVPDERLRVFWADWNRAPMSGYSSPGYAKRRANLEAWIKAFDGRVTVFQYYADHFKNSWFLGPLAVQLVEDREYILKHGVDGLLTLVYPDGYWWRSSLNAWLAGRVFFDASADPYALLREYALAYYGPAGEPMAAYLDEWARDPVLGMRSRFSALPFHFGKLRAQRRNQLDEAARRAAEDPVAQRRVATITTMHLLAETFMAVDLMNDKVDQLLEKGDVAGAQRELDAARRRLATAKELSDGLIAEKRGLVDPEIQTTVFDFKNRTVENSAKKVAAAAASPPAAAPAAAPGATAIAPAAAASPSAP